MQRILVVDDELNMRLVLKAMLEKENYEVATAFNGLKALDILATSEVAVVVTDLKMPGLDGMGLLEKVVSDYPSIPVIIITAHGTIDTAVDALKKGAFDYITKPFEQDDLKNVINKAFKTRLLNEDEFVLSPDEIDRHEIIGFSKSMTEIFDTIKKVAPTTTTILITGETGTGKELVANAIHRNSTRKNDPFIKINCSAISENLIESELFGYERGAFTGAISRKPGRFELAHKGTLFLDEVGDIPKEMQVKLLRVIQDHEFERVGGLQTIKVDVRLITATNRNLLQDVKEGKFRADLYYRLNVVPVHLSPLRERTEDINLLTDYFKDKFNTKLNRKIKDIDSRVRKLLLNYSWPGNIRELENLIERLILMARGDSILLEDIPEELKSQDDTAAIFRPEDHKKSFKNIIKSKTAEIEKQMIIKVLEKCDGNITKAAMWLGLSRRGLHLKMEKYNLRK
jgi:two-component system response regulator AtoC